jgi:arylsulfatase A-like enzyme
MYGMGIIIDRSDNGGCHLGGGKNYPYRGTKFTMLEGGTKVDAFIYSPLINPSLRGSNYSGLFHVSDWFPTILDLANITYSPDDHYALDGVSQVSAWRGRGDTPRSTMLYNSYTNAKYMDFDIWSNGCFAIRNEQ